MIHALCACWGLRKGGSKTIELQKKRFNMSAAHNIVVPHCKDMSPHCSGKKTTKSKLMQTGTCIALSKRSSKSKKVRTTQTMAAECNTCIIQLSSTAAFMLGSVGGTTLIPMAPDHQHKDCRQQTHTCKQRKLKRQGVIKC